MVFPNIIFTCNGSITKLIAGVDIKEDATLPLQAEVQIWRESQNESNSYIKIESVPLTNATQTNLNIILPTPMRFQEGDILYWECTNRNPMRVGYLSDFKCVMVLSTTYKIALFHLSL